VITPKSVLSVEIELESDMPLDTVGGERLCVDSEARVGGAGQLQFCAFRSSRRVSPWLEPRRASRSEEIMGRGIVERIECVRAAMVGPTNFSGVDGFGGVTTVTELLSEEGDSLGVEDDLASLFECVGGVGSGRLGGREGGGKEGAVAGFKPACPT